MVSAVRFDASSDGYSRTNCGFATLGPNYTMACWTKLVSVGSYGWWLSADNTSTYQVFGVGSSGDTMFADAGAGVGPTMTTGTWYYNAWTYSSSGNDYLYWAAAGSSTLTQVHLFNNVNAVADNWTFKIGANMWGEFADCSVAQVRVWNAQLSQAELEAEMPSASVVRTSNLWAVYSFASGPQTNDEAPSGTRTLTSVGTPTTDSSGPPVAAEETPAYTELEWSLGVQAPAAADDVYEFRVFYDDADMALDDYTVTPQLSITETLAGVEYDETNLAITIAATVTVPTDQVDFKQLGLAINFVATVTAPIEQVDFKELGLALALVTTVTIPTEQVDFKETNQQIAIVATVTVPTEQVDFKQLDLAVAATVIITIDDDYSGTALVGVIQEGFRWRNDDGSETAATWKATQDTDISLATAVPARLRVLLDATIDPDPLPLTLYYRKLGSALYTDDFNRANGAPGGNWTEGVAGSYLITDNKIVRQGTGNDFLAWNTAMPSTDHYVQAKLYNLSITNVFDVLNARGSGTVASPTCYLGYYDPNADAWRFGKMTAGSFSLLNGIGSIPTPAEGTVLRFEVQGTALRLYANGALVHSYTDSSITSGTRVGLNSGVEFCSYDDFEVGPLPYVADSTWLPVPVGTGGGMTASDTFDGTGALGAGWDNLNTTDPTRVSGELVSPTSTEFHMIIWQTPCSSLDQYAEVRYFNTNVSKSQAVVVRNNNSFVFFGGPCYTLQIYNYYNEIALRKINAAGTESILDTYMAAGTPTGYHTYRIEARDLGGGSHEIKGFYDGVEILSAVDSSSPLTGMYVGLASGFFGSAGPAKWDDFLGGDLAAPNPVYIAPSTNITAGGQVTTAQLSAPSGKTTADFSVGRMWDDENGTDLVDIGPPPFVPLDDFDRANGNLGSNWETDDAQYGIAGNKAIADATFNTQMSRWVTSLGSNNMEASIYVNQTAINTGYAAVLVRQAGSFNNTGYAASVYGGNWGPPNNQRGIYIVRYAVSADTQIAGPFAVTSSLTPFKLTCRIVGSTITALVDDVSVGSTTDSTYTTGQYAGFRFYCATSAAQFSADWFDAEAL